MNKTVFEKKPGQNQLHVERVFNAPPELVWKAWTTPELLDRWWAPKPWKTQTKFMDFRENGHWLYSMNGPDNEQHWSRADFLKIIDGKMFESMDTFCDEEGNKNPGLPSAHWQVRFGKSEDSTKVNVNIFFQDEEALEKIVEMGFKEGFAAAHDNLDDVLEEVLTETKNK